MRFEDGELALRPYADKDRETLPVLGNSAKVAEYLSSVFPQPYTREDADEWVEFTTSQQPPMDFAIEYQGKHVGGIGFKPVGLDYSGAAELGYWLGEAYWGKGLASRAVRLILPYAFDELLYIRVHGIVHAPNLASCRVLEKNGFVREGVLRKLIRKNGKIYDAIMYAKLRNP